MYGKVLQRLKRAYNDNNKLWKKEMISLINEENEYYEIQNVCNIRKWNLILIKMMNSHLNYIIK